jgi:phosphoribosylformylglycinamidine synthase subunit PurL
VTVPAEQTGLVLAKMKGAGVPCARIGTTGGDAIAVAGEASVSIEALNTAFERWLPAYMNGEAI